MLPPPRALPAIVTKADFSFFTLRTGIQLQLFCSSACDAASGALCLLSKYLRDEAMPLYNYRLVHFTNIGSENSQVEKT